MKKTIVIILGLILAGTSALRADPQDDLAGKVVRLSGTVTGLGVVLLYKAGSCIILEDVGGSYRQAFDLKNLGCRLAILAESREAYLQMQADGLTPAETPVVVKPVPEVPVYSHLPARNGNKNKSWSGFSLGIGAGNLLFAWTFENNGYREVETSDFNFELQGVFNFAFMRMGISTGVIFSRFHWFYEEFGFEHSGRNQRLTSMVDFCLLPMRFFAPNSSFQLYLGGTIGHNFILSEGLWGLYEGLQYRGILYGFGFGPKFGMEYHLGKSIVLFSEGNYVYIPDSASRSYFNVLIGIRYRFPFG